MTRSTDIDFLKGVAIIFMVIGHALSGWGWLEVYTVVGVASPLVIAHFYSRIKDSIRELL